MDNRLLVILG